jgi:hypothetical protein
MARSSQPPQRATAAEVQVSIGNTEQTFTSSATSPGPATGLVSIPPSTLSAGIKQLLPTPPTNKKQPSAMFAVQQPATPAPVEDAFAAFLAKKADADIKAKKAAIAQKSQQTSNSPGQAPLAIPSSPWGPPPPTRIGGVRHDHFKVNIDEKGTDGFQAFMQKKEDGPVTNGKRYSTAPINLENYQKQNATPTFKFDPHAVFSPKSAQPSPVDIKKDPEQNGTPVFKVDPHAVFSPLNWQVATDQSTSNSKVRDAKTAP